ncbi:MAG: efflux RND transporter permease subunit [Chloroflexaceae bacterium]|nr:efflux RND transporter permease subunit [Chloroflexaceae bacterium]
MSSPRRKPELNGVWLADTSIKQPVFVTMVMLALIVLGLLAYRTMPVDLLPEISPPVVTVSVGYSGANPESVADQVAEPIEEALSTLNGVETITTISSEGRMNAIIEFVQERDPVQALTDVREEVNRIRNQLPNDIDDPTFQRFDPAQSPIISLAVTSTGAETQEELRSLLDDEIVPRIQRVPGVGSVTVQGGLIRQINVNMNLDRLTALQILPSQVSQAISNANINRGLGDIGIQGLDVNLRAPSAIEDPQDITEIGILGTNYDVGDVATVEDGFEDVDTLTRLNGDDAINIDIRKQSGTNTVEVAENALEVLNAAFDEYPNLQYQIVRNDAEEVRLNVDAALEEIFFAIGGAALVLFLFLRNLRNTLTMIIGIPVIIIATFYGDANLRPDH